MGERAVPAPRHGRDEGGVWDCAGPHPCAGAHAETAPLLRRRSRPDAPLGPGVGIVGLIVLFVGLSSLREISPRMDPRRHILQSGDIKKTCTRMNSPAHSHFLLQEHHPITRIQRIRGGSEIMAMGEGDGGRKNHLQAFEAACVTMEKGTSTSKVKEAERLIRSEIRRPGSLMMILEVIRNSAHQSARQLASILLRKVLASHFNSFARGGYAEGSPLDLVKKTLLYCIVHETHPLVVRAHVAALATVTQRLIKLEQKQQVGEILPDTEGDSQMKIADNNNNNNNEVAISQLPPVTAAAWSDVLHFLSDGLKQQNPLVRQAVMIMYGFLAQESAAWLSEAPAERRKMEKKQNINIPSLEAFTLTLRDDNPGVRASALKSLQHMLEAMTEYELPEDQDAEIVKIFPTLLHALQGIVDRASTEDASSHFKVGLDAVDTLVVSKHKAINRYFSQYVETLVAAVSSDYLDEEVRKSAAESFASLLLTFTDNIVSGGHMQKIAGPLLKLGCDALREGGLEACGEDNFWNVFAMASESLPVEQGITVLFPFTSQMVLSDEPHVRAAGIYTMGLLIDGLKTPGQSSESDYETTANTLWNTALPACIKLLQNDPNKVVIHAALRTAGCVLRMQQDNFPPYGESVVASAMQLLHSATTNPSQADKHTVLRATRLVGKFLEVGKKEKAMELCPTALNEAQELVMMSIRTNDTDIMKSALSITVTAAERLGADFSPYFNTWMDTVRQLMTIPNAAPEYLGAGAQLLSQMAISVGRQVFEPHMKISMQLAELSLKCDIDSQAQASGIYFFATMCELLGEDTAQVIPSFLPYLMDIIEKTQPYDLITFKNEEAGPDLAFEEQEADPKDNGYEDPDNLRDSINSQKAWQMNSNNVDKLTTAVVALDFVSHNAPMVLFPHASEALEILMEALPSPSPDLTVSIIDCMITVLRVARAKIDDGTDAADTGALNDIIPTRIPTLIRIALSLTDNEFSTTVVKKAVQLIDHCVSNWGLDGVEEGDRKRIVDQIENILHEATYAQQDGEEDGLESRSSQEIKSIAVMLSSSLAKRIGVEKVLEYYSSLDTTMSSFFNAGILRAPIISGTLKMLLNLGSDAEILMKEKFSMVVSGLKDSDVLVQRATLAHLEDILGDNPDLIVVDSERCRQTMQELVTIITSVPEELDTPQEKLAAKNACLAMVNLLCIFLAKFSREKFIGVETHHRIGQMAALMLPNILSRLPYRESKRCSFKACVVLNELFAVGGEMLEPHREAAVSTVENTMKILGGLVPNAAKSSLAARRTRLSSAHDDDSSDEEDELLNEEKEMLAGILMKIRQRETQNVAQR